MIHLVVKKRDERRSICLGLSLRKSHHDQPKHQRLCQLVLFVLLTYIILLGLRWSSDGSGRCGESNWLTPPSLVNLG